MKLKHIVLPLLLLAAALLLAGCGGSAAKGGSATQYAEDNGMSMPVPAPAEAPAGMASGNGWMAEELAMQTADDASESEADSAAAPALNRKLVYTGDISLESTEFDASAAKLETLLSELGGWVESSTVDNTSRDYRRAWYTLRIPAENFERFCSSVGDLGKVNSITRSTEDISERYFDTESRLATQRTKLERLQRLLRNAENMEEIITLESAISETEFQIENLTGSLRKYDSLVGYSTVNLQLNEVYQLTKTEEPAIGFDAKLSAAFASGSANFIEGGKALLLGFARDWAGWLVFLAVVLVIVLLIVRGTRKRRAARAPASVPYQAPPPAPAKEPEKEPEKELEKEPEKEPEKELEKEPEKPEEPKEKAPEETEK